MSRLTVQTHGVWSPPTKAQTIGLLHRTANQLTAAYGWTWEELMEDGWGQTFYLPLACDGKSRYLLTVIRAFPNDGIQVQVAGEEDPVAARRDLLLEMALGEGAFTPGTTD